MANEKITAGKGGERYVPYEERTGNESVVYFTRDLSEAGLRKVAPTLFPATGSRS